MAEAQFVYGRSFETAHGPCVAGMPVHEKWNRPKIREFIKTKYGADAIVELDPAHPEKFLNLVTGKSGDIAEHFVKLKQLVEEQAKTIRARDREIERLKKRQALQA